MDAAELRVPEDQTTIQEAIDSAVHGDTVLVSSGTYRERLQLSAGVVVRSEGDDAPGTLGVKRAEGTIIDGSGGDEDVPGVALAEDSTLDGFTVTGVGSYDEDAWNRHHATRGDEQTDEQIGKPGIAGISAMQHSAPLIEANTCFENFYAGIGHASEARPLVIDNTCYGNIRAGIGMSENAAPVVRGNRSDHNRREGPQRTSGGAALGSARAAPNRCGSEAAKVSSLDIFSATQKGDSTPPRRKSRHAPRAFADPRASAPQTTERGLSPVLTRRRRDASEAWRAKAKRIFE